ncbi:MAG: hypothetical protein ACTHU0_32405 [Kofleriaceae bacterium]
MSTSIFDHQNLRIYQTSAPRSAADLLGRMLVRPTLLHPYPPDRPVASPFAPPRDPGARDLALDRARLGITHRARPVTRLKGTE